MPPVRALSADDHELFAEPFSFASMLACGKALIGGTAGRVAAVTLVVAVGATTALPSVHRPETVPGARPVAPPVTFVLKHAPAIRPARHAGPKATAVVRATPSTPQPVRATPPAPARPPARAPVPHAPARPTGPAPRAAPAPAPPPEPSAPPAAPPPPAPPVEAPHPVVPTLPPLPPVTDPQQPDVDRPSLPLGP